MADIKVLYINAEGLENEHSESADSVKFLSFKTATKELTDAKLALLIDGADAGTEHIHDSRYYRENEHINTSAGAGDAAKPIITNGSGKIANSFIDIPGINALLDHGTLLGLGDDDHTQYLKTDGTRDITGVQEYSSAFTLTTDTTVTHKKYVDDLVAAAINGHEWYDSAIDRLITPPGSPTTGDRYLIDATLGVATGAWAGKEDQVAEWDGSAWVYQIPTTGTYISVDDETTALYYYGGSAWQAKYFEATTASTGLVKVGNDIRIDSSSAGNGLGFSAGIISVNVDAATIEINADTLRVKADGINDTHIDFGTGANQVSGADIPLADAGGYFAVDNVEAALQELGLAVIATGVSYVAGVGGVTKGDLVYVSANNTVLPLSTLSSGDYVVGLALTTEVATSTVRVLANDTVLTGVLVGATAGTRYYWNGTGFQTAIPSGSGSNVWAVGVAKNATDLSVEVIHTKKNA